MRRDTKQRKHAMAGLRAIVGKERVLGTLVRVISSSMQAIDAMMLEMGRLVAKSVTLIECEEVTGPDYYSSKSCILHWFGIKNALVFGSNRL